MIDTKNILKDHVKNKKVLQTPFNHNFPIQTFSNVDNLIGSIWIALILNQNGISAQTINLIVKLARIGFDSVNADTAFIYCHNFLILSDEMKAHMLNQLTYSDQKILSSSFAAFSYFYKDFPLNFLVLPEDVDKEKNKSTLSIKEVLKSISNPLSVLSTFTMACTLACAGDQDKLYYPDGLAPDLNLLTFYPDTEEARKTAASVRTSFGALSVMGQNEAEMIKWIDYVWSIGEQDSCELEYDLNQFMQNTAQELQIDWE